jgi:hypothetical protein
LAARPKDLLVPTSDQSDSEYARLLAEAQNVSATLRASIARNLSSLRPEAVADLHKALDQAQTLLEPLEDGTVQPKKPGRAMRAPVFKTPPGATWPTPAAPGPNEVETITKALKTFLEGATAAQAALDNFEQRKKSE